MVPNPGDGEEDGPQPRVDGEVGSYIIYHIDGRDESNAACSWTRWFLNKVSL